MGLCKFGFVKRSILKLPSPSSVLSKGCDPVGLVQTHFGGKKWPKNGFWAHWGNGRKMAQKWEIRSKTPFLIHVWATFPILFCQFSPIFPVAKIHFSAICLSIFGPSPRNVSVPGQRDHNPRVEEGEKVPRKGEDGVAREGGKKEQRRCESRSACFDPPTLSLSKKKTRETPKMQEFFWPPFFRQRKSSALEQGGVCFLFPSLYE